MMASLGTNSFTGQPGLHPDVARRLDKLAQQLSTLQGNVSTLQQTSLTPSQLSAVTAGAANIQNAIGQPASTATIPIVTSLPANVSTVGAAVIFNSQLYVWNGASWVQAVVSTILDTWANITNYPPASHSSVQYYVTDRTVVYISNGANWIYMAGAMIAASGSRPTLGTNDKGFLFIDSGSWQLEVWDGSAWHNVA